MRYFRNINYLAIVLVLFSGCAIIGQSTHNAQARRGLEKGFKDYSFGMTSTEANLRGIFYFPPMDSEWVASEYGNQNVRYVAYEYPNNYPRTKAKGYGTFEERPIRYICFLFYHDRLFRIRIHFFDNCSDSLSIVLKTYSDSLGIILDGSSDSLFSSYKGARGEFEGHSTNHGKNTMIAFTCKGIVEEIFSNVWKPPINEPPSFIDSNANPKVWAVLVGISKYSDQAHRFGQDLGFCNSDAQKFFYHLTSVSGGALPLSQVVLLTDSSATKQKIIESTHALFDQANPQDFIIFYFSGHGGEDVFLGFDSLFAVQDIKQIVSHSASSRKLCIADACHASFGEKSLRLQYINGQDISDDQITKRYYESLKQTSPGLALFMACKPEEVSWDDSELGDGIFTYFCLDGLKGSADLDNDGIITISELNSYVSPRVNDRALKISIPQQTQHPQLKGIFDSSMPLASVRRH